MIRMASTTLLLAALMGCAQTQSAATDVKSAVQAQATPSLSTADASFLNEAGQAGITEVTFGQLARTNGGRAAVRDYGLRMVGDHTTQNQALTRLAVSKQLVPSSTVDLAHQAEYARLAVLRGKAFDRAYLDGELAEHMVMLTLFQTEAAGGTDTDVKAFAAASVPRIQAHLDLARQLGAKPPKAAGT